MSSREGLNAGPCVRSAATHPSVKVANASGPEKAAARLRDKSRRASARRRGAGPAATRAGHDSGGSRGEGEPAGGDHASIVRSPGRDHIGRKADSPVIPADESSGAMFVDVHPDGRFEALLGAAAPLVLAVFDALPDAIGMVWPVHDGAGRVVDFEVGYTDPSADRMMGLTLERERGTRLLDAMPAIVEMGLYERLLPVARTGTLSRRRSSSTSCGAAPSTSAASGSTPSCRSARA